MSIDIDQCVFVGDRDQDSVVLGLADEECRLGSKIFRSINLPLWSVYHPSVREQFVLTRISSTSDDGMLHIETGLDQCGTVVDQTEDGDIAFHNVISVTEYNSGSSLKGVY